MLLEAAGGLIGSAAGVMAYGVRGRSSTLFGPSVYRGSAGRNAIAITFDDGPSESTALLLRVLAEYGVTATFFQCGVHVRRLPDAAREVAAKGHEIGNHTDSHPHLYFKSAAFISREIELAQDSIHQVTGRRPQLFRAPYGVRWFGLRPVQRRLSLLGVMWTAIGRDWKWPSDRVADFLARQAGNGAIFCLHDGRGLTAKPDIGVTIEAVRKLIPRLLERGFQFETVSQILCPTK